MKIEELLNQYMTIPRESLIIYGCTKKDSYLSLGFDEIEACLSVDETLLYNDEDSISAIISVESSLRVLKEFYRVLKIKGILVLNTRDQYIISEAELVGFRYLGAFNNSRDGILSVLIKMSSSLDNINFDYLVYTRDNHYRDISQKIISKIIDGFENVIVDINQLNKYEITDISIIKSITIYTKNSIENVKSVMIKIKDEVTEIMGIDITAKRISQNKVHIFSPLLGLNIYIYNLFYDFDKIFEKKDIMIKAIMLEHSYHEFAFLNSLDMDQEYKKIEYLENEIFDEVKPLEPRLSKITLPKDFPHNECIIIGFHKYGFKIGPIEIIYIGDKKKLRLILEKKENYSLTDLNGDFQLRGPFVDVYDTQLKRMVYRIYMVNSRCIPYENYTLSMKYLMANFFLDRRLIKDIELIKRACAGIIKYYKNTADNFKCIGKDISDQYKFEIQIWEQPKWLFKITI